MKTIKFPITSEQVNTPAWFSVHAEALPLLIAQGIVLPQLPAGFPPDTRVEFVAMGKYHYDDDLSIREIREHGMIPVGLDARIEAPGTVHRYWVACGMYNSENGEFTGWGEWEGDLRKARHEDDI